MNNIKHFLLTVLVALVGCVEANAYDFEVDGICYNVLSVEDLTCEVTKKGGVALNTLATLSFQLLLLTAERLSPSLRLDRMRSMGALVCPR